MYVLAFDTSAYTSSLALVDEEERLLWEGRRILTVDLGRLGLRQSEAVFAHIKNLAPLWEAGAKRLGRGKLAAVAAATQPRPIEDSYMPVFKVGQAFGTFIAQTMDLPFISTSHQEGHIMAGLWSAGLPPGRYLVAHLSGGTTELLTVTENPPGHLRIRIIGGSLDLHAGQFVDRLGVAMGFQFPAGKALEELAGSASGVLKLPVAVTGTQISFSGPASQAERYLQQGCCYRELARAVEICLADSLARVLEAVPNLSSFQGLLLVGGVASNRFIQQRLKERFNVLPVSGAAAGFSGDNAVGVAVQAVRRLAQE
ncbi:MAG: O-sialoglycoprotein endopeptidase [Firmicutes bacterium]|nr:O-sialoglycoprotein endopeptidase [Bacillota bacterium]